MTKRLTVFYSWQSDTPSNLNRNFIEKALHEALKRLHSDATLENALRDATVELEKDTKGVAGSPPIVQTILRKIEECAVFVADFTFVGESKGGLINSPENSRQFPNPNVLIEYGYALRHHSHVALVGIMNTAFGRPDAESLPFNLRHHRWPITYHLSDSSAADRKNQFEKLVETLVEAIGLILVRHSSRSVLVERFVARKSTTSPALFFNSAEELVVDRPGGFSLPRGGLAYLRLSPTIALREIDSELEAKKLADRGGLQPLGKYSGYDLDRNVFGAIVFEARQGKVSHLSQLFLNREIWGIDGMVLNEDYPPDHSGSRTGAYIASGYIAEYFTRGLQNYMAFAHKTLEIPSPMRIEAGLVGINGYPITLNPQNIAGKALRDAVQWETEASHEQPAWEILAPFFDRIWDNCGLIRPAQKQVALAKFFGG